MLLSVCIFASILIRTESLIASQYENLIKSTFKTDIRQCVLPDVSSQIGVIFIFLPNRYYGIKRTLNENNGVVFQLHHFYSLLLLVKQFKSNAQNKLLFYYINSTGKPVSNHYNRWLDDPDWIGKIGSDTIKFIELNYSEPELNLYDIIAEIKHDSLKHLNAKITHAIMATSDILIGPRIMSCFSQDTQIDTTLDSSVVNTHTVRAKMTSECFESIHSGSLDKNIYFSFLYKIESIHQANDFSGLFIWKLNRSEQASLNDSKSKSKAKEIFMQQLANQYVTSFNNYKCHYKRDTMHAKPHSLNSFENSFCVFGFEMNAYDIPRLEDVFFKENYLNTMLRKYLYNSSQLITYSSKTNQIEKIPNVVHLIWFADGPRPLKFIEYLCLKSIMLALRPEKIKIHGDNEPIGHYWIELTGKSNNSIEWIFKERTLMKYGQNFNKAPIQHIADFSRLEVLYEEGGIYSDFDILWVKKLDNLREIDAELIASNDITSYCDDFPNSIQIGTFLARPKSPFVKQWLDGYKKKYHLYPGDYAAVSMCEPYKIYEKYPRKVFIENRLQMIYFNGWSAFIPRYLEYAHEKLSEFNEKLDWLNNGTYGYHLPRHSDLFSIREFEKANKSLLPIKIATYIYNMPFK